MQKRSKEGPELSAPVCFVPLSMLKWWMRISSLAPTKSLSYEELAQAWSTPTGSKVNQLLKKEWDSPLLTDRVLNSPDNEKPPKGNQPIQLLANEPKCLSSSCQV